MAQEISVLYIHMNYKIITLTFQLGMQRLSTKIAWRQQNILVWFTFQKNNIFHLILLSLESFLSIIFIQSAVMPIFTFHWFFLYRQVPYCFGFLVQIYVVAREMFG